MDQSINRVLKNIKCENQISEVSNNKDEYYDLIEKFGVTKRLNKIIDSFEKNEINGSKLYEKLDLNIGIICDEFLYYSLKDTANFIYIPFTENLMVNKDVDVLLVVTSWRGLDHSWDYVANPNGRVRAALLELIEMYKDENIKTVFYSKEDPVSYKQYLSIAEKCDYIFTSANEMIPEYIKDTGNQNVDFLEFGINPLYHNPIGKNLSDKKLSRIVTFAGSWMVRFPRRNAESLEIFKGVNKAGYSLSIIDRQFERKMERYHFPSYLIKNISETIPHERLMKLHKATKWGINLNSVQDSYTMFANRVYELQAMGNVVISNYNKGVQNKFPNILLFNKSKEVETLLRHLPFKEQKRLIADGMNEVMLHHTSFHRMSKMINMIGYNMTISEPSVLIIGESGITENSFENQNYSTKTYITMEDFEKDESIVDNYDYISFFSDKINYGSNYIENLLSTFAYTVSDIVSMNKDNYKYTNRDGYIKTASMIDAKSYKYLYDKDYELVYFNIPRTEIEPFEVNEIKEIGNNGELSILIPVQSLDYKYLENKTLINMNKVNANVYLVTNGILDKYQINIIKRLQNKMHNIVHLEVPEAESISQALNSAIRNITTKYLMFLNPGNTLSVYNLKQVMTTLTDVDHDVILTKQNNVIQGNPSNTSVTNEYGPLINNNVSFDTALYKTDFIIENEISFNEDIMTINDIFLYNSLFHSNDILETNKQIVNVLTAKEYEKLSPITLLKDYKNIEIQKRDIFMELGILEDYVNSSFPELFINEYLPLMKKASAADKSETFTILEEVFGLYNHFYERNNKKLNSVIDLFFA